MNTNIQSALETDRVIDITTTGRRSGRSSRIEIWFHNVDGGIYITGTPGTRDWYANLVAEPAFTFHLKQSANADLAATAVPVVDPGERRRVLETITKSIGSKQALDDWAGGSPLVRVEFG